VVWSHGRASQGVIESQVSQRCYSKQRKQRGKEVNRLPSAP
jgi:hypothetical protein